MNNVKNEFFDEEEYVDFETAKILSSLGFIGNSLYGFTCDGVIEEPYYGTYYCNGDKENSVCYEAPTKFIAIKWLKNFAIKNDIPEDYIVKIKNLLNIF